MRAGEGRLGRLQKPPSGGDSPTKGGEGKIPRSEAVREGEGSWRRSRGGPFVRKGKRSVGSGQGGGVMGCWASVSESRIDMTSLDFRYHGPYRQGPGPLCPT